MNLQIPYTRPPAVDKTTQQLALLSSCLAFIIVILDVSVVNVALKSLHAEFPSTIAYLEWVVSGYTLTFAAFLLTAGALGDRFGPKKVFIVGFIIFAVTSFLCGIAHDLTALIIYRLMQGLGAALVVPASLAIVHQSFPEQDERSRAIGLWAASGGMALALGPVFGGLLISLTHWRAIFFVNVPIALVGSILAWQCVKADTGNTAGRVIDILGQILAALALGGFTLALIQVGSNGLRAPLVIGGAIVFLFAGPAFIYVQNRKAHPMLPLSLFKNAHFSASCLIGILVNFAFYGLIFLFSLFFQYAWTYSPLDTGLAFLPMTGSIMIANLLCGKLMVKHGYRAVLTGGIVLAALGYLSMMPFVADGVYVHIGAQFVIAGAGIGLAVPAMTNAMVSSTAPRFIGVASGVLNASRQIGGLIGVASMGLIIGDVSAERFASGMAPALRWSIAALAVGGVISFVGLRRTAGVTTAPSPGTS
jgi:DHA2 family methylenomycin A resistance protein-like MFS transporter